MWYLGIENDTTQRSQRPLPTPPPPRIMRSLLVHVLNPTPVLAPAPTALTHILRRVIMRAGTTARISS